VSEPRLRVRSSGQNGSGYVLPARFGDPFKEVKNSAGETIKARVDEAGNTTVVPGVTTVLKQLNAPFLIQWAVNRTLDWANDNASLLMSKSDEDVSRWGKYRHTDVRDERAEIGTHVHEYIECDLSGRWDYPYLTPEEQEAADQWVTFRTKHEITPLHTEVTLWDGLSAGTADIVYDLDGKVCLDDIKTSKGVYWSAEMQVAALSRSPIMLLEDDDNPGFWVEEPTPTFDEVGILHIRPDWFDPDTKKFTPAFHNRIVVPETEISMHYEAFKALRTVARTEYDLKRLRKTVSVQEETDQKVEW